MAFNLAPAASSSSQLKAFWLFTSAMKTDTNTDIRTITNTNTNLWAFGLRLGSHFSLVLSLHPFFLLVEDNVNFFEIRLMNKMSELPECLLLLMISLFSQLFTKFPVLILHTYIQNMTRCKNMVSAPESKFGRVTVKVTQEQNCQDYPATERTHIYRCPSFCCLDHCWSSFSL